MKDGTFVVRDNTRNPGEFSLSLWHGGGIRHLKYVSVYCVYVVCVNNGAINLHRIRKRQDGLFVLGEEKIDEVVSEL